ncbi:outer membrane protein assembly factor BamB family protein [Halosimplex halobium]|uniref:outer membrane protein assembly factor BamB family protein n=1 Tax=Halosimplex halobium TaxID=3396618 RepID=UPI003F55907E
MPLKLHPGPTGEVVHTTGQRTTEQIDTSVVDDFNAGLLLEYDPSSGYVWSFVNVYRSDPEQFIATYETDGSTGLDEFQQRVREAVEGRDWSIREGTSGGQVVFDNLTSADPTGPPISDDLADDLLDHCGTLSFAAPDELTAVRLFRYFYDRYGDDRSYAICRQPPSQFDTDADIYIEPNDQFDGIRLTGQAADARRDWKVADATDELSKSVDALVSAAGEKLSGHRSAAGVVAALERQGFDEAFPVTVRQKVDQGVNWEGVAKTGLLAFAVALVAGLGYATWRGSFTELASLATDSITYTFPPHLPPAVPTVEFTAANWQLVGPLLAFLLVTVVLKRRVRVPLRRAFSRLRSLLSPSPFPEELDRRAEQVVSDAESLESLARSTDELVDRLSDGFADQRVEVSTTDRSWVSKHSATLLGVVAGTAVAAVLFATASAITELVVDNWNPVVDGLVVVTAVWVLGHVAYGVGTLAGRLWPSSSVLRLPLRLFTPPSSTGGSKGQQADRDVRLEEIKRLYSNTIHQTKDTPSREQVWKYIDDEDAEIREVAAEAAKKLDDESSEGVFDKPQRQKYKQILRNRNQQRDQRSTRADPDTSQSNRSPNDERSPTESREDSGGKPAGSNASGNAPEPASELDPVTEGRSSQAQSSQRTESTSDGSVAATASGGVADKSTTPAPSGSSGSAPMVRYDAQNTGSTSDPGPANLKRRHRVDLCDSEFVGPPVSDGKFACVADRDGGLYVYDIETHEKDWETQFSSVTASPCLHDGNVYVPVGKGAKTDPRLVAYDLRSGTRQGQLTVSGRIVSSPVPTGEYIYLTDRSGRLYAASLGLDRSEFTKRFNDMRPGRPVVYEDKIYFADANLLAVAASSGRPLQTNWPQIHPPVSEPVLRNKRVFIAAANGIMDVLHSDPTSSDSRDGTFEDEARRSHTVPPIVSPERIALCYHKGEIEVYTTKSDHLWSVSLDYSIAGSPTLTWDGRLYVAEENGAIRIFSPDGNQLDVWARPNGVAHSPTVVGERLLVADADGRLYVLEEG